jgi:hypothetical protein
MKSPEAVVAADSTAEIYAGCSVIRVLLGWLPTVGIDINVGPDGLATTARRALLRPVSILVKSTQKAEPAPQQRSRDASAFFMIITEQSIRLPEYYEMLDCQ